MAVLKLSQAADLLFDSHRLKLQSKKQSKKEMSLIMNIDLSKTSIPREWTSEHSPCQHSSKQQLFLVKEIKKEIKRK
jgi:hypothetical protein